MAQLDDPRGGGGGLTAPQLPPSQPKAPLQPPPSPPSSLSSLSSPFSAPARAEPLTTHTGPRLAAAQGGAPALSATGTSFQGNLALNATQSQQQQQQQQRQRERQAQSVSADIPSLLHAQPFLLAVPPQALASQVQCECVRVCVCARAVHVCACVCVCNAPYVTCTFV
jgi:hypothetical protein